MFWLGRQDSFPPFEPCPPVYPELRWAARTSNCPTIRPSPPSHNSFRINTCKSESKQKTLTLFRMNTYEKQGEGKGVPKP